ncbi:hypothetical protein [Streptomyces curacoi]|uniref:Uncharacterized protein n=1 Tax=Streptomyces curacoi TaxID=146536 RepID=A0A117P3K2_9ACTN|nr:hypothetical protein [Streptomyces curacoi]KUM72386.1 hypothetical protein AQI70_24135 [Streptomyces curacoi]
MFRLLYDAVAQLFSRPAVNDRDLARETRTPDPYTWRLPNPRDARWRRWAKRSRAAGYRLPFPHDDECWSAALPSQRPLWETSYDVVRPYVLRP